MSTTLPESWRRLVTAAPDAVALIDATTQRRWTRRELDRLGEEWREVHGASLANRLVLFSEPNGVEWLRVFLGLLKSDAVAVALDPGEPAVAQQELARTLRAAALWQGGARLPVSATPRRFRDGRRIVKLTSGSTGVPKPLPFTDAQVLADGRQLSAAMGIRPDDVNLGLIPWGHSYGLGNLIAPLLDQGTALIGGISPFPHAIAAAIEECQPTIFPAVPALLRALAESDVPRKALQSLRTVISAGAPLAPEIAQAFHAKFGRKVHSFYGSSETGGISYDATGDAALTGRSVGAPLPTVQLQFGRAQRFSVRSAAVYTLGNRHPGAHRMADVGRIDEHGELVLLGRAGRFVKIAGRRLNLAEVEHALKKIDGVHDALVAPHPERADALAAVVATVRSSTELKDALRDRLAAWKIPRKWIVLPEFPLTARGKTDARKLRELLRGESR